MLQTDCSSEKEMKILQLLCLPIQQYVCSIRVILCMQHAFIRKMFGENARREKVSNSHCIHCDEAVFFHFQLKETELKRMSGEERRRKRVKTICNVNEVSIENTEK